MSNAACSQPVSPVRAFLASEMREHRDSSDLLHRFVRSRFSRMPTCATASDSRKSLCIGGPTGGCAKFPRLTCRSKPSGAAVTIELAPYECLRRPLTAIRLRASHLRSMAELDVATTPIDRGDVVILFEQRTGTSSDNAYFVIRTETHTALCRMIAARRRSLCISVSAAGCRRYRENDR